MLVLLIRLVVRVLRCSGTTSINQYYSTRRKAHALLTLRAVGVEFEAETVAAMQGR